jgi:GntR family transcriptional regulator
MAGAVMLFHIQPDSPVPIYEQIVTQITFAVASGALEVGTLIPSVRELAGRVVVHPNTVARAFQELERSGIVIAKRGRGMEVTPEAPERCQALRQNIVRNRIRQALHEATSSGLTTDEVRELVEDELIRAHGIRTMPNRGRR